jgi:hypothetical protein
MRRGFIMVHTILKTSLNLLVVPQGYLDTADPMIPDTGKYYDEWIFAGTTGQTYLITAYSEQFPTQALLLNSLTGEAEFMQSALVFQPGYQAQFSGTLDKTGQYSVLIFDALPQDQQMLGAYLLRVNIFDPPPEGGGVITPPVAQGGGDPGNCYYDYVMCGYYNCGFLESPGSCRTDCFNQYNACLSGLAQ